MMLYEGTRSAYASVLLSHRESLCHRIKPVYMSLLMRPNRPIQIVIYTIANSLKIQFVTVSKLLRGTDTNSRLI